MRKLFALCLTVTLTGLGLGATTTTAQASAPTAVLLNEILINTNPNVNPTGTRIDGVEIVKPSGTSINGYKIQACDSAGNLSTVATLDTRSDNLYFVTASDQAGLSEYNLTGALYRDGGVRLINASSVVVDAVSFDPANSALNTCLGGNPDAAPAPTDTLSAQRICDTGPWVLAPPTFGGPNFCL